MRRGYARKRTIVTYEISDDIDYEEYRALLGPHGQIGALGIPCDWVRRSRFDKEIVDFSRAAQVFVGAICCERALHGQ